MTSAKTTQTETRRQGTHRAESQKKSRLERTYSPRERPRTSSLQKEGKRKTANDD